MANDNITPLSLLSSAGSWSLAEDESLLSAMHQLSFNISSQAKQLLDKMDQLAINTALAQTRLQTATNNFMLLSNIKFIEARVYEDSEVEPQNEIDTGNLEKAEALNEEAATSEALKYGINVINTAFEKVEINDSDSDSDVEEEKVISVLQPRNPYHVRSLPAIIGTEAWLDDDKIGLIEEEIEDESEESSSESEDDPILPDKKEDSEYSESDSEIVEKPRHQTPIVHNVEDNDSISDFSDDEELFKPKPATTSSKEVAKDHSESEDNEVQEESSNINVAIANTFSNELSSKLGLGITHQKSKGGQKDSDSSEDEVEEKPKSKTVKLPPKKSVLFDSSDSDDDLFTPKTKANPLKPEDKKKPSDDAKFNGGNNPKKLPPLPPPSQAKPKSTTEEQNSKDVDSNSTSRTDSTTVSKTDLAITSKTDSTTVSTLVVSNVESESDDDFFSAISSKPVVAANTAKKEVGVSENLPKATSLFEDSSEDDDIFSDFKREKLVVDSTSVAKTEKKNIFDDSDDSDDLFADLLVKHKEVKASQKPFEGTPELASKNEKLKEMTLTSEANSEEISDKISKVKKTDPPPVPAATTKPMVATEKNKVQEADEEILPSEIEKPKTLPQISPSESKPEGKEIDSALDKPNESESGTKTKKPIGGVSMFGGFDPKSFMKSTENSEDNDEEDGNVEDNFKEDGDTTPTGPTDIRRTNLSSAPSVTNKSILSTENSNAQSVDENNTQMIYSETTYKAKTPPPLPPSDMKPKRKEVVSVDEILEKPTEIESGKKVKKPVGGVSMFSGFAPNKIMESAQSGQNEDEKDIDTKEKCTETLITLTKSRPKMKGGRKPPTRAGRKNAIESSNALAFDVIDGALTSQETVSTLESSAIPEEKQRKMPLGGVSMLGGINPAQLLKSKTNSTKLENSLKEKIITNTESVDISLGENPGSMPEQPSNYVSDFEKETLSVEPTEKDKQTDRQNESSSEVEKSDDGARDVSAEIVVNKESAVTTSLFSDNDDESISFEPPPMENVNEKLDKKNNLFGFDDTDSDDDMFSNIPTSSKTLVKTDHLANIFDDDDSDDDLFSSLVTKRS